MRKGSISAVLDRFCSQLDSEGRDRATVQSYRSAAEALLQWLRTTHPEIGADRELPKRQIGQYRSNLIRNFEPATVNRKLAGIRSFLRWSASEGMVTELPRLKGIELKRAQPREGLSDRDQIKLRNSLKLYGTARDRAIIAFLLDLGLQVEELCALKCGDVQIVKSLGVVNIHVPQRANKRWRPSRVLSLSLPRLGSTIEHATSSNPSAFQDGSLVPTNHEIELLTYLLNRKTSCDDESPLLDRANRTLTRRAVELLVLRHARLAGVKATAHLLRATYQNSGRNFANGIIISAAYPRKDARHRDTGIACYQPSPSVASANDTYQDMVVPEVLTSQNSQVFVHSFSNEARDPLVRDAVLRRANGRCERCGFRSDVASFFEVHHLIASRDTRDRYNTCVALCPNCHRMVHFLQESESIEAELLSFVQNFDAIPPQDLLGINASRPTRR